MNLNKSQTHNKKLAEKCEEEGWSFLNCGEFHCTVCGKVVSPAVVKYFDYKPLRFLCYSCQKKLKVVKK